MMGMAAAVMAVGVCAAGLPAAAALVLGAIVAPPDAAAASTVLASVPLQLLVRTTTPLLALISAILFWRGHNAPGGGFIAALVGSSIVALVYLSAAKDHQVGPQRQHALHAEGVVLGVADVSNTGQVGDRHKVALVGCGPPIGPKRLGHAYHSIPAGGAGNGGELLVVEAEHDALGWRLERDGSAQGIGYGRHGRAGARAGERGA